MNAITRKSGRTLLAAVAVAASALTLFAAVPGARSASAATGRAAAIQPAVTPVQWHDLSLVNQWQQDTTFPVTGMGKPAWAVRNGVVYLRGAMHQVPAQAGLNDNFAVLPQAARPANTQYLRLGADGEYGELAIMPSGYMFVDSVWPLAAKFYSSLDGVSFPAAPVTGTKLALVNGWISSAKYLTGDPAFWQKDGMVHLLGGVRAPNGFADGEFAQLPPGARPAHVLYLNAWSAGGVLNIVTVGTDGALTVQSGQGEFFTALSGLSFPAAPQTGKKLTLINGWESSKIAYNTGDPAYWVNNGIVHLIGSLDQPGGSNNQFAVLPAAARPTHYLRIPTYTNNGKFGWLIIKPTGEISVENSIGYSSAKVYTSLAAVSYPVNS
jgi:hypothetical protein